MIVGAPVGPQCEFKFFKKAELVNSEFQVADESDAMDIRLRLLENGDDRILVEASTGPGAGNTVTII
jgi:hypothetical protein